MTSQLNVDAIVDKAGSGGANVKMANTSTYVSEGGNATQNTVQGLTKHWGRANQTASNSIQSSFNNASVSDGGTGILTFNNTSNFSNGNYAPAFSTEIQATYTNTANSVIASGVTASGMKGYHVENGGAQDTQTFIMQAYGDLA
tara:strand:- start:839 stop:1270 length:432 start_codon:yes stop_codon:yes gene_type:complete